MCQRHLIFIIKSLLVSLISIWYLSSPNKNTIGIYLTQRSYLAYQVKELSLTNRIFFLYCKKKTNRYRKMLNFIQTHITMISLNCTT